MGSDAAPSGGGDTNERQDPFEQYRELLFAVAYRMLGTVADTEDVLQDTWLRWRAADRTGVVDVRAYLVRAVSNTALNRLGSARARREQYVGPWLPEPVLTEPDVSEHVELDESVSMAMLVVLETLSPLERAVFVLREVFGFDYAEIAEALDRSVAGVRQVAHRARSHVQARRPRYGADRSARERVTREFLAACADGDLARLLAVLSPEVTLWTDGGGRVRAALRPIHGPDRVGRFLIAIAGQYPDFTAHIGTVNGGPAAICRLDGHLLGVVVTDIDAASDRIEAVRMVINPDKLGAVADGHRPMA